ncbi:MAG: LCP family protein [Clostridium sp.]|uniref:LCP family protein n=1 Tax=Clostridium sp. TaxID=1506 RepID=UPI0029083CBC|nr:LCP family protein [Clostridium sp.]MDU4937975.1 LCP family protein [Clostridium sp.]
MKKRNKVLIAIMIIMVIILGGIFGAYKYINKIKNVKLQGSDEELKVSQETQEKSKRENIENILLLGVDNQENATDTIMILSLDKDDNTAKLTSVMRDTYVNQGQGKANKINYAYHYGGVEGTISTLNELFNLDINKYALIDFDGLVEIIDYLGGINLNITEQERKLCGASNAGNVVLNGSQALAYSRIRHIDNDFQRTARQREIMFAILKKCKDISLTSYPSVISDLSSNVQTNLSTMEMLSIAKYLLTLDMNNLNDFRVPIDGTTKDNLNGVYHLDWDKEANVKALHEFIYGK